VKTNDYDYYEVYYHRKYDKRKVIFTKQCQDVAAVMF